MTSRIPRNPSQNQDKGITPSSGFMLDLEKQKREDELNIITTVERQVQGVLGEIQYIAELLETNKTVAPVEDIHAKIRAAYQKIKAYSNSDITPEQMMELENKQRSSSGISVEQNPLIKEMGGMPLEVISAEWRDHIEGAVLDKSELENIVNKKLKDRAELANKLKLQHKLKAQPGMKRGQELTPKFEKLKATLKYIMKEMPEPPRPSPSPRQNITPPRPY